MSTDMWMVVQARTDEAADWVTVDRKPTWGHEDYSLYAQLADVKNGTGAGGMDGFDYIPVAQPKGLPDGFVNGDDIYDDVWIGDRDFSWFTLGELQSYDLSQTIMHFGVISFEDYLNWDGNRPRNGWCRSVGGPSTKTWSMAEAYTLSHPAPSSHAEKWTVKNMFRYNYVLVSWIETYGRNTYFWKDFVGSLSQYGTPDNVRIVFGFSS